MEEAAPAAPDGASLGDMLLLHGTSFVLGLVVVVCGTRVPQLLALVSSAGVGLWIGLVMQEGLSYHHTVFGLYMPTSAREPLIFCIVFAVLTGVLSFFARRTALALLTAVIVMLNAVTILRVMDMSPAATSAVDTLVLPTFPLVAVAVLVASVLVSALVVCRVRGKQLLIGFNTAQLGMLLILSSFSQIVQRAGASAAPFSILGDLARIMAQPRGSRCATVWSGEEDPATLPPDDLRRVCICGVLCRAEILAWIIGSWGLLVVRRMWCRSATHEGSPRSRQHRPVPREEEALSPSVLGAATDGTPWSSGRGLGRGRSAAPDLMDDAWEDPQVKLRKLREWLEEGLISLGDFETKKRELLGRM